MLEGFDTFELTADVEGEPLTKLVYRRLVDDDRGGVAPAVVVMHEMPGITPSVAAFAERLAREGLSVYLPVLFGEVGRPLGLAYNVGQLARACVSREFALLAAERSSPLTEYLRALCRRASEETGGRGVGALGMCITGNFALALMVEPCVKAPVLSQPSLPLPLTPELRAGLHVSTAELATLRGRVSREGARVLGLRFTGDILCPGERFARLRAELGEGFEGIEIDSSDRNVHGVPRVAHSVLTNHLVDEAGHPTQAALARTLEFFRERLR